MNKNYEVSQYLPSEVPHVLSVLPSHGKLKWSTIKPFSPYSYETFRKYSKLGRAPAAEAQNCRMNFYDAKEVHKWLADPTGYQATKEA